MACAAALRVAAPQRVAAADGLQVDPAAAAGAVVDRQARMPLPQFVPHPIEPFDVADLGHALAVGRVGRLPERQRVDVEVVAVDVDAPVADALGEIVGKPLPGGRVAEVEQAVACSRSQHPLGMLLADAALRMYPLRLEPHDELHAAGRVRHRPTVSGRAGRRPAWAPSFPRPRASLPQTSRRRASNPRCPAPASERMASSWFCSVTALPVLNMNQVLCVSGGMAISPSIRGT